MSAILLIRHIRKRDTLQRVAAKMYSLTITLRLKNCAQKNGRIQIDAAVY